ncbi:MAG: hypothetical protein N2746_12075 [Deltaproteobacteria bacterium]|nr:hypothetical protein [Deltaproteobacteria bacterium]
MKKTPIPIIVVLLLFSCTKELLHSIQEEQANDIITLLNEHGIKAEKILDVGQDGLLFKIVVPESDYGKSWNILRENGLPREKIRGLSDIYQKQGLISSSFEEQALLIQAIKGEVEKTLETIDNVIKARVIISLPTLSQNPFSETEVTTAASVLLKVKKGTTISKDAIKGILTGALSSLEKERITVEIVESSPNSSLRRNGMTSIGPFVVSESSARMFYFVIMGFLSTLSLGIGGFLYFLFRKKTNTLKESEEL